MRGAAMSRAVVLAIAAITLLLLIGPVLDRRAAATGAAEFLAADRRIALALLACGSLVVWHRCAWRSALGQRPPPVPCCCSAGSRRPRRCRLLAGPRRLRVRPARATAHAPSRRPAPFLRSQLARRGVAVAIVLVVFERLLPRAVDPVDRRPAAFLAAPLERRHGLRC